MSKLSRTAVVALVAASTSVALGQVEGDTSLRLDLDALYADAGHWQPEADPARAGDAAETHQPVSDGAEEGAPVQPAIPSHRFGLPGGWWFTAGTGYANDFSDNHSINAHIAFSTFLDEGIEFVAELVGWYFIQEGDNTGAIGPSFIFRWHFYHTEDWDFTVYADIGFGVLASFDDVPSGGSSFNLAPRAGMGMTGELGDGPNRWQLGVRWAHVSNGRLFGESRNPSRDSIMVYGGLIFPF